MRTRLLAFTALLLLSSGAQAAREEPDALGYGAYLSALFAADQHDMTDAAKFYRESLARDPNDPTLLARALFYETSAGEIDEAGETAKRMIAASPDDRVSRLVLTIVALKRGDYKEVHNQTAALSKTPFAPSMIALIDAWAAAGARDEATVTKDLGAMKGPAGGEALAGFHQALILEYMGKTAAADAAYADAMKADIPSPRLVDAYGRFLERSGRAADAKALYDKLALNSATSPVVAIGQARLARGERPDPLIKRAQDGIAEALFGIAASLTDQSNADVSVLYLRLSLYLEPNFDLGQILLGDRMETLEKYTDAIEVYRKVSKDSPYRRMADIQVATDEARLDRTDDAIRDLKVLADADATDVTVWMALGDAYRSANKFAEAATAYDQAVKAAGTPQKKDWLLYYARAIAEERSHNWNAAEADLQTALKLNPDEPQILNFLGYSWVDQNRNIAQALAMLEKARALKPYDGYIVDSVGWAYYRLGRFADAEKALQEAVLLVPGDPTINDHYGDVLWKVGRKLDAHFQWDHALNFGPEPDEKSQIEKKLKADFGDHS